MKLVIVESPAKCQTIGKYLGNDYIVMASYGHIRDLSTTGKGGLGVDIERGFIPTYVNDKKKEDIIKELKKKAKNADEVILATDPDREGEAIAWHLANVLELPIETTKRLEFHEITKTAIENAISNYRTIDMNLVQSQECRRILDRIVGFKLTGLLKKKIKMESAGRVQSATLKLIIEHEKEIDSFIPEDYWIIYGTVQNEDGILEIDLKSQNGQKLNITSEQQANNIISSLNDEFKVTSVKKSLVKNESKAPFTTSTMQQEASRKYKFSTKKTAMLAQGLYEGKTIGDETVGLITYMRTDSERLSPVFVEACKEYIVNTYGEKYLRADNSRKQKKQIQDAHEAIRPTSIERTPAVVKPYLSKDEYNLYRLIYNRALASLMSAVEKNNTNIELKSGDYEFGCSGSHIVFDGYLAAYKEFESNEEEKDDEPLKNIKQGDIYHKQEIISEGKTTMPPAHYTEGKVVEMMEKLGIGRPSTYASTISLLLKRAYIKNESGYLIATKEGYLTSEYLDAFFSRVISYSFTAEMEETLDRVVSKESSRNHVLTTFCDLFDPLLEEAINAEYKIPDKYIESVGVCPNCGSPLVKKKGAYGQFVACSNYPNCNYIQKKEVEAPTPTGENCPQCGSPMVFRKNKRGEQFEACSNFPKCKYIKQEPRPEPTVLGVCPDCGGNLLLMTNVRTKKQFVGCSNYPKCHHIEKYKG